MTTTGVRSWGKAGARSREGTGAKECCEEFVCVEGSRTRRYESDQAIDDSSRNSA